MEEFKKEIDKGDPLLYDIVSISFPYFLHPGKWNGSRTGPTLFEPEQSYAVIGEWKLQAHVLSGSLHYFCIFSAMVGD
jgi:hypothetical protein